MEIKGQDSILRLIDSQTTSTFPNSLILLGEKGGGKHLLCQYIADKLNLTAVTLSDNLSQELIEELYTRVEPYLYIIEEETLTVKRQNMILKFLEEPLKNSFIVILSSNKQFLLPTIINRCQVWELAKYSVEILKEFSSFPDSMLFDIVRTPGEVLKVEKCHTNFNDLINLLDKLIEKTAVANFSNILTISDKIDFDNKDDGKFDILIVVRTLVWLVQRKILESVSAGKYYKCYELISELSYNLTIPNINKKLCFENFLTKMKRISIYG